MNGTRADEIVVCGVCPEEGRDAFSSVGKGGVGLAVAWGWYPKVLT
jgi:hypothetical protein